MQISKLYLIFLLFLFFSPSFVSADVVGTDYWSINGSINYNFTGILDLHSNGQNTNLNASGVLSCTFTKDDLHTMTFDQTVSSELSGYLDPKQEVVEKDTGKIVAPNSLTNGEQSLYFMDVKGDKIGDEIPLSLIDLSIDLKIPLKISDRTEYDLKVDKEDKAIDAWIAEASHERRIGNVTYVYEIQAIVAKSSGTVLQLKEISTFTQENELVSKLNDRYDAVSTTGIDFSQSLLASLPIAPSVLIAILVFTGLFAIILIRTRTSSKMLN